EFCPGFGLQRLSDIDLTHALQSFLGENPGEHPDGPGEVRSVQPAELPKPHDNCDHAPGRGTPPTVLTRTEVHLPTFQHQLPLKRRKASSFCDSPGFL